jgi:hypothetical protein
MQDKSKALSVTPRCLKYLICWKNAGALTAEVAAYGASTLVVGAEKERKTAPLIGGLSRRLDDSRRGVSQGTARPILWAAGKGLLIRDSIFQPL